MSGHDVRHVVLPWARPEPPALMSQAPTISRQRTGSEPQIPRVQMDRLAIRDPNEKAAGTLGSAGSAMGQPPLLDHGLLFHPHPSIPDEDRTSFDPDALLAAAVALDILATGTRGIDSSPTVLTELTEVLLALGHFGGMDDTAVGRLLDHAQSPVGNSRAGLSRHVAVRMSALPQADQDEPTAIGAAHASTPRAAAKALRRIEMAADVAVREARLLLDAQEIVQYKQA